MKATLFKGVFMGILFGTLLLILATRFKLFGYGCMWDYVSSDKFGLGYVYRVDGLLHIDVEKLDYEQVGIANKCRVEIDGKIDYINSAYCIIMRKIYQLESFIF